MATSLPSVVGRWRAPVWATSTTTIDGGVAYSCTRSFTGLIRDHDDGVTSLDVHLLQQDDVDIDHDGQVLVIRRQPVIAVEELRLTLRGAALLRNALDELLNLA